MMSRHPSSTISSHHGTRTGIATVCLRPVAAWDHAQYRRVADEWAARPRSEWEPFWEYGAFDNIRDVAAAVRRALTVPVRGHHRAVLCAAGIAAGAIRKARLMTRDLPRVTIRWPRGAWRGLT
jgi:UDP-glucose 4-epimerase